GTPAQRAGRPPPRLLRRPAPVSRGGRPVCWVSRRPFTGRPRPAPERAAPCPSTAGCQVGTRCCLLLPIRSARPISVRASRSRGHFFGSWPRRQALCSRRCRSPLTVPTASLLYSTRRSGLLPDRYIALALAIGEG